MIIPPIEVSLYIRPLQCFKPGKKIPKEKYGEFERQLQRQEDGLNKLSVDEYLKGRDLFKTMGRGSGNAQAVARSKYQKNLTEELKAKFRSEGATPAAAASAASKESSKIMDGLAALHEPDMIAGGKNAVGSMGDRQVNSSLGSQWKGRVDELDKAAKEVPEAERKNTKMNTKLERCK